MNRMLLEPPWLNFFKEVEQKALASLKLCAPEVTSAKLCVLLEFQTRADVRPVQGPDSDWTGAWLPWPGHLCLSYKATSEPSKGSQWEKIDVNVLPQPER